MQKTVRLDERTISASNHDQPKGVWKAWDVTQNPIDLYTIRKTDGGRWKIEGIGDVGSVHKTLTGAMAGLGGYFNFRENLARARKAREDRVFRFSDIPDPFSGK